MLKVLFITIILVSCSSWEGKSRQKTVLLFVHGANFTASSWNQLRGNISNKSVAINLPGRNDKKAISGITLRKSAIALCQRIKKFKNDIVLIAHSQGGAVVNESLGVCSSIRISKIIYLAAVVPLPGEKPFDLLSKEDEGNYLKGIEFNEKKMSLDILKQEKFISSFSADASSKQKIEIMKSAVSEPALIGEGKLRFPIKKLKDIRKYYIHTLSDKIISYESQLKITKRLKFNQKYHLKSGHLPMITRDKELAKIIEEIILL